ncbi:MAG: cell division protein FtsA [Solirubrobacterales bacterium]
MRSNIRVVLDLGASKIAGVMVELLADGTVNLLALASMPSQGIRRGTVVDIETAVQAIDQLFEDMEDMADLPIKSCRAGYSGTISSLSNRAIITIGHGEHEITDEDIRRAISAARTVAVPPDRSVLHLIPRMYSVDGYEGIVDPHGMIGSRLEVEVLMVTAATNALQNLVRTIQRGGVRVKEIVANGLLVADAVLLMEEKEMGVAVIDFGAETCDIAMYIAGTAVFTSVVPIGGEFITRDLAVGLRTTLQEARNLKEEYGLALPPGSPELIDPHEEQPAFDFDSAEERLEGNSEIEENIEIELPEELEEEDHFVDVVNVYGNETRKISKQLIYNIIRARVEEILEMLDNELKGSGYGGMLPAGIVLTGGTSNLKGIVPFCEEYLGIPFRKGVPENIPGIPNEYCIAENAALLGAVIYGDKLTSKPASEETNQELAADRLFSRFWRWLREFF